MGLSRLLLVVAVATAVAPIIATRVRPPASLRELEQAFVVAVVTLGIGAVVTDWAHGLDFFALAHLGYLLVVVTAPVLLVGWWLTGLVRRRRTRLVRAGALVGVLLAAAGVWGTHVEPNWLDTDVVTLAAPVERPLTIGVLADLQTPNIGKHEWRAVEAILDAEPDMVLVPGDLFQAPERVIDEAQGDFVELLSALTEAVPVVAVVSGDSDGPARLQAMTEAAGALFVDDRIVDVTVAGQPVRIAGVAVRPSSDRLSVIADLNEPTDAFTVLLSHRPDVVFELPLQSRVDVVISGHTHGGQISLPVFGPPVTLSEVPRSLAAGGLAVVDRVPVYVSSGVGLERGAAPQVRFGARPSVGVVTVVPNG